MGTNSALPTVSADLFDFSVAIGVLSVLLTLAGILLAWFIREVPIWCKRKDLVVRVPYWYRDDGFAAPAYSTDAQRLAGFPLPTDVYDYAIYQSHVSFNRPPKRFQAFFQTCGTVWSQFLVPFQDHPTFPFPEVAGDRNQISQSIKPNGEPYYIFASHVYNGLQEGHEDFQTKVTEPTDEVRLVVDLTAVPHILEAMTEPPKALFFDEHGNTVELGLPKESRRGLYVVEGRGLEAEQGLKLDITLDWSLVCPPPTPTSLDMAH